MTDSKRGVCLQTRGGKETIKISNNKNILNESFCTKFLKRLREKKASKYLGLKFKIGDFRPCLGLPPPPPPYHHSIPFSK